MKRGTNPLFPTSDGKGVKGAYEQAALMDDSDNTFGKTKVKPTGVEVDFEFATDTNKSYREFSDDHREIIQNYKQELKKLKHQKKTGEISSDKFRELKRALVRKTDAKNRAGFKRFLLGK